MVLVSPNLALFIFVAILIVSAVVAWRKKDYEDYDKCSFHTFVAILAGLGVFVTFMFYYNVVALQKEQQELAAVQEISKINEYMTESLCDEMARASAVIPNFVLSITPLTNTVCESTAPPDPVNPVTCTEKMVLSTKIFSLWGVIMFSNKYKDVNPVPYVCNFLQRTNSQQLYQEWLVSRINFSCKTKKFGDLLFEYGLPIKIQKPEVYVEKAKELINDPRYKEIFSESCWNNKDQNIMSNFLG